MKNVLANVSGFIAQLVERRTGIARSRVQAPLKSWIFFRLLYAIVKIAIITARIILHLILKQHFYIQSAVFGYSRTRIKRMRMIRMMGIWQQQKKKRLFWKRNDNAPFQTCCGFLYTLTEAPWQQRLPTVFAMCWVRKIPFFVHRARNAPPERFSFQRNIRKMVFRFLI